MKIVFATEGSRGLNEEIAQHFGKCPTYTVVEVLDGEVKGVEVVDNPTLENHQPNQAPQFIAGLGADYIVSGGMGPRAVQNFTNFGIQPIIGVSGTVKDVLDKMLST